METVTAIASAIAALALLLLVAYAEHARRARKPVERIARAEERRRTTKAIEHLERDVDWMASLTGSIPPTAGQPRRILGPLELQADPVEPDIETRRNGNDQLYVVRGPITDPTITDLTRGVHLEFVHLTIGDGMEMVVNPHDRTAYVQADDEDNRPHRLSAFHKIVVTTAVWTDPDAAAEQYAARLDNRNRDAGVTIERNGAGDVTITTDPEQIPNGEQSIVVEIDEYDNERVEVRPVGIVDTAALERYVAESKILPNAADLELEPVAIADDPPLDDVSVNPLECETEYCVANRVAGEPRCAACKKDAANASFENPVQDACDQLADQLQAAKEDADEDTAPEPVALAGKPGDGVRATQTIDRAPGATGLQGPRLSPTSAAPLPSAAPTVAPRTIPPGDNPVPAGWVSAKDAIVRIGCSQPPLAARLRAGEVPGRKHPARNRHGFIWIITDETCQALEAEFGETGRLRMPTGF